MINIKMNHENMLIVEAQADREGIANFIKVKEAFKRHNETVRALYPSYWKLVLIVTYFY